MTNETKAPLGVKLGVDFEAIVFSGRAIDERDAFLRAVRDRLDEHAAAAANHDGRYRIEGDDYRASVNDAFREALQDVGWSQAVSESEDAGHRAPRPDRP